MTTPLKGNGKADSLPVVVKNLNADGFLFIRSTFKPFEQSA